jgi:hypothetical protein
VIDAVDLVFLQGALDLAVQGLGRLQIVTEPLLYDALPLSALLLGEAGGSQPLYDGPEKSGCGQIEKIRISA